MKPEDLATYKEYQQMSREKQLFISEVVREASGLSGDATIPVIVKAQAKMKALSTPFTKEESAFLMTTLMSNLSPSEQTKFELLRKLMKR